MRNSPLKINEEVKTLKLNVTTIRSILIAENKRKENLKDESEIEQKKKKSFEKLKDEEKNLEKKKKIPVVSSVISKVKDSGTNILDKILNFGGLILAGILVNNLPKIIETVRDIIDSIVNFLTPIQSGFNLIKGILSGDINQSEYDADKKRFDDSLSQLSEKGGLIDQIAEKAGPLEGLIKLLKPAVDVFRNLAGGKDKVLAVKDGQEGVKNTTTGEFTPRQFTQAERSKYIQSGGKGLPEYGPDGRRLSEDSSSGSMADSPGGSFSEGALISALDAVGYTNKNERAMFLAQMAHESGNFRYDEEIWGPTSAQKGYEGRSDLGNNQPGDGYKYRGRGYIQLTGRANYRQYGKLLGVDLENNPDLAKDPNIAARVAIEYWKKRVNRTAAQKGDVKTVTYNINGGYNGLNDRIEKYEKYLKKSKPQPKSSGLSNYGSNYKEQEKMLFERADKYRKNKTEVSINQPIDDEEESNLIIAVQPITNETYLPIPIG